MNSQEHSSPRFSEFVCNITSDWLNRTVWYGLANQKLCYIQMLLNIEESGEQDQECSEEWLVNTGPGSVFTHHSQEHSLSFSPRFSKFVFNTTSDWPNGMV